jgi:tetratricopeptide (TPR) repeat protein
MALSKVSKELVIAPEEKYQALLRSLRRTKGFGILFVQCSPAEANNLITKVKQDLPQKKIDVLTLKESIDNLYEIVDHLSDRDELNILFIQGIEKSLEAYIKHGYAGQGDYYNLDTVPQILNHLNQQRENFRDHFSNICFVFIVPLFALKYFIHRAPDFFDWRSGVFSFPTDSKLVEKESLRVISKENLRLDPNQRHHNLLEIEQLLEEKHQTSITQAELFYKQGQIFDAAQDYEEAIASYDKALTTQPHHHGAWSSRGDALRELERYEEAIASYDKTLTIQPDDQFAWFFRGFALSELKRYEEAIASYYKALQIQTDFCEAWFFISDTLIKLERYEEAIGSYDKALAFQPDDYWVWDSRGDALSELGRYEEAIASYDKALEIQPDDYWVWDSRGNALSELGRYEEAIASYDKALEIQPDYHWAWFFRGFALGKLERYEEAILSYDKALAIQPDYYWTWYYKAEALSKLGRHEEEKKCLERALQLEKSDDNEEKLV